MCIEDVGAQHIYTCLCRSLAAAVHHQMTQWYQPAEHPGTGLCDLLSYPLPCAAIPLPLHGTTSALQAVLLTDNVSFLHIRNYTNPPFGVVEARSVTLIAPDGARINYVPTGILQSIASSTSSTQRQQIIAGSADPAAIAAAQGDAAGIVTATDSYVLGASNATMIPLMQRLAGQDGTQQPLFVAIASNLSLAPRFWGSAWPTDGLQINRPVVWAGSSWDKTSIDLGMQVGQVS